MTTDRSFIGKSLSICLLVAIAGSLWPAVSISAMAQAPTSSPPACRIQEVDYQGWHGQQISNDWVQLIVIPQNGGRLIQVTLGGHPYLFVNPKFAGKYFPPTTGQWFNYGGDKVWLLPEGNNDEQHWVGDSDILDDGPFTFRKLSEGKECEIELTGPVDAQTGIQFVRTIAVEAGSPRIRFHATMKNITGHTVDWSMQSVSQYNTSNPSSVGANHSPMNRDFWTFTPANPVSSYLNRYHVRFGPAENRAVSVRDDGLFSVHYVHQAAELWLDSTAGWLAVVDGTTQYAMVERFQYEPSKNYPGKASVIFWTNGPEMRLKDDGEVSVSSDPDASPYYLEAELNSPMCHLRPGEACTFETEWFPTRAGAEFHGVSEPAIIIRPLRAVRKADGKIALSGIFGVFFPGHLVVRWYDQHGAAAGTTSVMEVKPTDPASLQSEIAPPAKAVRVSLHLVDSAEIDRGALQEVLVENGETP